MNYVSQTMIFELKMMMFCRLGASKDSRTAGRLLPLANEGARDYRGAGCGGSRGRGSRGP